MAVILVLNLVGGQRRNMCVGMHHDSAAGLYITSPFPANSLSQLHASLRKSPT
jgi:hypothetical protein